MPRRRARRAGRRAGHPACRRRDAPRPVSGPTRNSDARRSRRISAASTGGPSSTPRPLRPDRPGPRSPAVARGRARSGRRSGGRIAPGEREAHFDLESRPLVEIQGRVLARRDAVGLRERPGAGGGHPRPSGVTARARTAPSPSACTRESYVFTASWEGLASVTAEQPLEVGKAPLAGIELRLREPVPFYGRIVGLSAEELIDVEGLARRGRSSTDASRPRGRVRASYSARSLGATARLRRKGGVRIARARIVVWLSRDRRSRPKTASRPARCLTLRGQVTDVLPSVRGSTCGRRATMLMSG